MINWSFCRNKYNDILGQKPKRADHLILRFLNMFSQIKLNLDLQVVHECRSRSDLACAQRRVDPPHPSPRWTERLTGSPPPRWGLQSVWSCRGRYTGVTKDKHLPLLASQTWKSATYSSKTQKEAPIGCLRTCSPCLFSKFTTGAHVSVLMVTSGSCAVEKKEVL